MPASIYDIICEQGATLVRVVTYNDSAGSPVNLIASGGSGIALASNGEIEITVPAATTAIIPSGKYRYDLEVVSSSGIVTRVIEGDFTVSGEVTR